MLRALQGSFSRPGVLAVSVRDNTVLESHAHLDLSSTSGHLLIGRHQRCDLYLAHDAAISLRHGLLRASRIDRGEVRLRLLDLCSGVGFRTEDDVPCESLVTEGALMVRAGRYHLFFLPTGELASPAWSDTAKETWESFPDRVYLDRRVPDKLPRMAAAAPGPHPSSKGSRTTHIVPPVRPLRSAEARGDGVVLGHLVLKSRSGRIAHVVTDEDLERGILVGRYERCQLGGAENSLSRIHLLVLRDEQGLWAIDTASTNGTTLDGNGVRAARIDEAQELGLGGEMALQWVLGQHARA